MSNPPDNVSLAEHQALWQRAQNVEQRERELLREQDRLKHERDAAHIKLQRWQSDCDQCAKYADDLTEQNGALRKELDKLRGELAEAKADSKAPAWDQYHGAVARASDLQITNKNLFEECERLNKRIDELEGISNGLRKELAEQKNDALNEYYVDIERVAKLESALKAENERLKEDRDRLREHLKEAGIKRANYKREVRRLQDALLRQRGQHRWVEIERLEQRVQALEGKEGHARLLRDAFALCGADTSKPSLFKAALRDELRKQKLKAISKCLRAEAESITATDDAKYMVDAQRLLDELEAIDNGESNV